MYSTQNKRQRSSLLIGGQNLFHSLPRQLQYFAPRRFEEYDDFILLFISSWFNYPFLHIILGQKSQRGKTLNKLCHPFSSDDLCLPFFYKTPSMLRVKQYSVKFKNVQNSEAMLTYDFKYVYFFSDKSICFSSLQINCFVNFCRMLQEKAFIGGDTSDNSLRAKHNILYN